MTPQSNFMIAAPIDLGRIDELKCVLGRMNQPGAPGMAAPDNPLIPFGQFDALHYARLVIVDDQTLDDFAYADMPVPSYPITLAFLGDCDGPADELLAAFVAHRVASKGLRKIFSYCNDFDENMDLLSWMKRRDHRPAAAYVNWIGRTVQQIHKEAALRRALQEELIDYTADHPNAGDNVREVRNHLIEFVKDDPELMPVTTRTPLGWRLGNALHFALIPFALLVPWLLAIPFLIPPPENFVRIVTPFVALAALSFLGLVRIAPATFALLVALGLMLVPSFFILFPLMLVPLLVVVLSVFGVLRWYEMNDRELIPSPSLAHEEALADLEDHDVSNQFTVIGSVKPSAFRRLLLVAVLWFTDYGARHIYNRGFLARIQTIHFARWVFVDNKRRVLFASNYDGSHQAYMDDFINKVGWGLNIVFSNGFGYPRTHWLIFDGAKNELRFKDTNRRHQIATQVWYKAYPGLTAFDLARNTRIREGLERRWMSDAQVRAWLREL